MCILNHVHYYLLCPYFHRENYIPGVKCFMLVNIHYTYLYYDRPYKGCLNINIEDIQIEDEYLADANNVGI